MTSSLQALQYARKNLAEANCHNADNEARWMLEELRREFSLKATGQLPEEALHKLHDMLRRRKLGEPLQYILGNTDFHDINVQVGPGVLIPRPETELLVELALQLYPGEGDILDLCTGSGAIALALAHKLPHCQCMASDISPAALHWACINTRSLNLKNVRLLESDLFEQLPSGSKFSLITANPPYVSNSEYQQLPKLIKEHEPALALQAGKLGLDLITRIINQAPSFMHPDAYLIMEIGSSQGEELRNILMQAKWRDPRIAPDLAGLDRFVIAKRPDADSF
ncbi:MAG: peptide chain release factor N(5)-glutamine methyltransferase [Lentisphaeria bacterium]|nr:peptide chain release factor N(5)-glutamine methyltransferase [Lentisphaeria bacterium]